MSKCKCGEDLNLELDMCLYCGRLIDLSTGESADSVQTYSDESMKEVKREAKKRKKIRSSNDQFVGLSGVVRSLGGSLLTPRIYSVKGPLQILSPLQASVEYETNTNTNIVGTANRNMFFANAQSRSTTRERVSYWIPVLKIGDYTYNSVGVPHIGMYHILQPGGWVGCIFARRELRFIWNSNTGASLGRRPSIWGYIFLAALSVAGTYYAFNSIGHPKQIFGLNPYAVIVGCTYFAIMNLSAVRVVIRNWKANLAFISS